MSAHHCALVHNTAQNSADNIPSPLILQTIIIAQMLSTGRQSVTVMESRARKGMSLNIP